VAYHAETNTETDTEALNDGARIGFDLEAYHRLEAVEHQPFLEEYATECPVRSSPNGDLLFLRMDETLQIQRHPGVVAMKPGVPSNLGNERPLIPLQIDGPLHTQYRKILDPLFSPRKVAPLEPAVRELADKLIDRFIDRGEADLYGEFCAILPATVFVRLMGIPESDISYFMSFKDDLLRSDPEEPAEMAYARFVAAGKRCYEYFSRILDEREKADDPGNDLIAWFLEAQVDGHRLTRENILDITYLLMIAGLDTVAASLSCFFSWLARHPEDRRHVVANPTMWPQVVEELLRFETPVPNSARFAIEDIEINGRKIPAGTQMSMSWAAANLDPAFFEDPLTVDFSRTSIPHVTFASGFHRCLGSHLARMELRTALDQFHRRIPDYQIRPGTELHYEALPVRLVNPLPIVWG
jgi:cytochrome P450